MRLWVMLLCTAATLLLLPAGSCKHAPKGQPSAAEYVEGRQRNAVPIAGPSTIQVLWEYKCQSKHAYLSDDVYPARSGGVYVMERRDDSSLTSAQSSGQNNPPPDIWTIRHIDHDGKVVASSSGLFEFDADGKTRYGPLWYLACDPGPPERLLVSYDEHDLTNAQLSPMHELTDTSGAVSCFDADLKLLWMNSVPSGSVFKYAVPTGKGDCAMLLSRGMDFGEIRFLRVWSMAWLGQSGLIEAVQELPELEYSDPDKAAIAEAVGSASIEAHARDLIFSRTGGTLSRMGSNRELVWDMETSVEALHQWVCPDGSVVICGAELSSLIKQMKESKYDEKLPLFVCKYSSTGKELWRRQVQVNNQAMAIDADSNLYFLTTATPVDEINSANEAQGQAAGFQVVLHKWSPEGEEISQNPFAVQSDYGEPVLQGPLIDVHGKIYLNLYERLLVLDSSGNEIFQLKESDLGPRRSLFGTMNLGFDGNLYLSGVYSVLALGEPATPGS